MVLKVEKEVLIGSCNACGKVSKLDNNHKVIKFVIKYPPTNLSEIASSKHQQDHQHKNRKPSSSSEVRKKYYEEIV